MYARNRYDPIVISKHEYVFLCILRKGWRRGRRGRRKPALDGMLLAG